MTSRRGKRYLQFAVLHGTGQARDSKVLRFASNDVYYAVCVSIKKNMQAAPRRLHIFYFIVL